MQRRTALQQLAVLLGGITLTPEIMARTVARAASGEAAAGIGADRLALLAEMADTILPDTDTPGAKAANVHQFISLIVQDCFSPADQNLFWTALDEADRDCQNTYGNSFAKCDAKQRFVFLEQLEKRSKEQPDPNFWRALKGLTLFGYFSSEIGMTQALAYDPIPGGWVPDLKIDANTKAWAPMF